jgi:hypothetical protein
MSRYIKKIIYSLSNIQRYFILMLKKIVKNIFKWFYFLQIHYTWVTALFDRSVWLEKNYNSCGVTFQVNNEPSVDIM